jgi:diguanylate cyclase
MLRVLERLLTDHEIWLVLLAALVCAFGVIATLNVSARARGTERRGLWMVLLALCAGATVWATHFIAMLAYMTGMQMTYEPALTALSFVAGAVIMGAGFAIAMRKGASWLRPAGGMVVGAGVVALHYLGMAAVQMPGHLSYSSLLVGTSVLFSLGFGAWSLNIAFSGRKGAAQAWAAVLMVLMIVSLHFTAMGAVGVTHDMSATLIDGVSRPMLAVAVAVAAFSVLLIGMVGAIVDSRVSMKLAAEADRFRALSDGAFEGLVVHRYGRIIDANAAARRMFGLAATADGSIQGWFNTTPGSDGHQWIENGGEESAEVTMRRPDGTSFPAEVCRRRLTLGDGEEGELFAIRDLTARKEYEERIAHLALHDPLTEVPNRRFFMELSQKALSQAQRTHDRFAMLAVDLDNFKLVNDMHGHAAGDELLRVLAHRITSLLRESDVVARFGGDEFAILQSGSPQAAQTMALAERIFEALRLPVCIDGVEVTISASIGCAMFPDDGSTVADLLRNADTAMYRAKADGKATCRFFEAEMDAALLARRRLEFRLRNAIAEEQLTVSYQPIVSSSTHTALAFEALLRWNDAELGSVMPSDFIPVAEETGLIVPLGEFVLRQACRDAMTWPASLRVAVNLSAAQFRRKGLVETVKAALSESGLSGDRLELEVTETLLVENREDALRTLNELKELGVLIAMDDFGTGYSSLSYLQSFPFDKIKIDRAFVMELPDSPQNASIVRAVAAMGRSLNMRIVAEGVETTSQAEMLQELDCDEMQGFLFSKPIGAREVSVFLDGQRSRSAAPSLRELRIMA